MRVTHGGSDILVSEEFPDGPDRYCASPAVGACRRSSESCGGPKGRVPRRDEEADGEAMGGRAVGLSRVQSATLG
jgi:hypothetical protein